MLGSQSHRWSTVGAAVCSESVSVAEGLCFSGMGLCASMLGGYRNMGEI